MTQPVEALHDLKSTILETLRKINTGELSATANPKVDKVLGAVDGLDALSVYGADPSSFCKAVKSMLYKANKEYSDALEGISPVVDVIPGVSNQPSGDKGDMMSRLSPSDKITLEYHLDELQNRIVALSKENDQCEGSISEVAGDALGLVSELHSDEHATLGYSMAGALAVFLLILFIFYFRFRR